jgi:LPXTG-site transpeptidase (sortase) family protein
VRIFIDKRLMSFSGDDSGEEYYKGLGLLEVFLRFVWLPGDKLLRHGGSMCPNPLIGHSFMTTRTPSNRGTGCLIDLLMLCGLLLIITGTATAYPVIRDALLPTPAGFGETRPLLRPTVTPLPAEGQQGASVPPAELPETPLLAPNQTPPLAAAVPDSAGPVAGKPTRIVIPSINLDAPIETVGWSQVDGVSVWDIPNHFSAGWLKTSAPLGQPGNTVLDGHHNIAGEVFRYLIDLKPGAVITVYADDQRFSYAVASMHILPDRGEPIEVRRQNATWIQPTLDDRLTLVTCWPYTSNTHRLIVVAKPISPN